MVGNRQPFFGPCKLRDRTPLRIEEYQQARLKQDTAPATSNRELALLKHMFFVSERWGQHQGTNPVRLVKFLPENNSAFQLSVRTRSVGSCLLHPRISVTWSCLRSTPA